MKTIYKRMNFGILVLLLLISSGCEDFLDRYPDNALTANQLISDIEYSQTTIIALYDLLSETYLLGRDIPLRGSLKGADFFHFTENPDKRFDREYKYAEISSNAGQAGYLWNYSYKTISNCNNIISIIPELNGPTELKDDMLAQAQAIKAICYLELLRAFCYPLWMANDDELYSMGVPLLKTINDHSISIENPPGRESLENCFNYVIELLVSSVSLVDKSRSEKQFLTEQAIWGILANAYLYNEKWQLALEATLNAELLGGTMIGKSEFISSMTTRFNSEAVFEIYYDLNDNLGTSCLAYYSVKTVNSTGRIDGSSIGYGDYGASNAFINLFTPEDVRSELFKEDKKSSSSSQPGEAGYSARAYHKYMGIESELIHEVPYIRLPEILLIAAEAYSEIPGNDAEALNYLNKVYSARTGMTHTGLSGDGLKTEIFNERRRELALEGHELYDYLRKGRSITRDFSHPSPLKIDPVNGRNDEHFHRVVYPIPQPEMDANPNLRDEQNPGYAAYQGSSQ
ncbi:RagB/SusD family nutrient uptake outer membrane protein [Bacteroidota bacterium]